jgi:hypothetical protein
MIDFSVTTPFRLVRMLATAGYNTPSIYLLICEAVALEAVQADTEAELKVQLGLSLRSLPASGVRPERIEDALGSEASGTIPLVILDQWLPKLVASFDRNVVLLATNGTVLLLGTREIAERTLAAAPNLRNRVTDVLSIRPDQVFGDLSV